MKFTAKSIPGVYELEIPVHRDERGSFVKTFLESEFKRQGLAADFKEVFYSVSGARVLRGMHVQAPPADQVYEEDDLDVTSRESLTVLAPNPTWPPLLLPLRWLGSNGGGAVPWNCRRRSIFDH
jgi:hypothetical protein